jgi:hypothetical protein
VQKSDFLQRAQAIAAQAQSAAPDLIGIQEAALWQTGTPSASFPPPSPTTVSDDFVNILVNALNARGLHYALVAITTDFTLQGPGLFPAGFMNVQLTDRVAILARTDIPLTISNVQTGNFTHNTVISTLQGLVTLTQGWAAVDATLGQHTVRFVTAHLADNSDAVGSAQAAELAQGPLSTSMPVIMTCDCNADPCHHHLRRAHRGRAQRLLAPGPSQPARLHLLPGHHPAKRPAERHLHAHLPDRLHLQPRRRAEGRQRPDRGR